MNYSRLEAGDIVVLEFLFSDQTLFKRRPALIVTPGTYNENSVDVIALKITSVGQKNIFSVPLNQSDLSEGLLYKQSFVRVDFPTVASHALIGKPVARVKSEYFEKIKRSMSELYEL